LLEISLRVESAAVSVSRKDLLRRGAGLLVGATVLGRLRWLENAYGASDATRQTLQAVVDYVVPGRRAATTQLIRTLDRFLPGPVPLSSTAATILDAYAKQVGGKPFAALPDLTAFLAYSAPSSWRLSRYSGVSNGRKEFKGYWHA
jgi:hypothetical protein